MKNNHKILVVVPTYNCSLQIPRVIKSFDNRLLKRVFQVAIINDKSKDNTQAQAKKAIISKKSPKIHLYTNLKNRGLGGTHKAGYLLAKKLHCTHLAIIHGDDQAETVELNRLIDVIQRDPSVQAVLGSRFMKNSRLEGYSTIRIFGNIFLNLLFTILTLKKTLDLGSGLNLFSLDSFQQKDFPRLSDGLTFNVDLLLLMYQKNINLKFIGITWKETDQISNAKIADVGKKITFSLLKWRLGLHSIQSVDKDYALNKII